MTSAGCGWLTNRLSCWIAPVEVALPLHSLFSASYKRRICVRCCAPVSYTKREVMQQSVPSSQQLRNIGPLTPFLFTTMTTPTSCAPIQDVHQEGSRQLQPLADNAMSALRGVGRSGPIDQKPDRRLSTAIFAPRQQRASDPAASCSTMQVVSD